MWRVFMNNLMLKEGNKIKSYVYDITADKKIPNILLLNLENMHISRHTNIDLLKILQEQILKLKQKFNLF